ncbi:MAG: molybdopterin-dependent oxidoreductase [Nitrospinota bacterium]
MGFEQPKTVKESVTLTIDGKELTVPSGKMVVEAALENDIYIPTLCWLKKLSPIGSCRICVVEVEGAPEPMTACQLPVEDGLVIKTQSEALDKLRRTLIKMVLVNHPLDCPVCERAGECQLQNMTYELGAAYQENRAAPIKRSVKSDWGLIRYYPHLCVLCERCIRVCREVQGFDAYRISSTGYSSVIDTKDGKPLDCEYCGQCVSVCPVGALNSSLILPGRSWDFEKVESVCGYCAVGCSLTLDIKRGELMRVSSDDDAGFNDGNLCVRGRFGYEFVHSEKRIKTPLIKKGDRLVPASWDEALTLVAGKLKGIIQESGAAALAGIGSERALNEDNYLFQKFFRTVLGSNNVDNLTNMRNRNFGGEFFERSGLASLGTSEDIAKGDLFFAFGADPGVENPVAGNMVRKAMRSQEAPLLIAHYQKISFKPEPESQILYKLGSEIELIKATAKLVIEDTKFEKESACVENYEEYAASLGEISVEGVSERTGVSMDEMKFFAQKIVRAKRLVVLVGSGVSKQEAGRDIFYALQGLSALVSGSLVLYRDFCNTQGANDMGVLPDFLPGYQKVSDKTSAERLREAWGDIPGCVETEKDVVEMAAEGKIKGLVVMGEDLVSRYHDGNLVQKALGAVDFLVVMDLLPTETALLADVVLPSTSFAEREGTMTNMEGRVQAVRKGVQPVGEAVSDWEIISRIGRSMSDSFYYESRKEISDEIRELVPLYGKNLSPDPIQYGTPSSSVRVKLVASGKTPATDAGNPLLISLDCSLFHFPPFTEYGEKLGKMTSKCLAKLHPEDAQSLGVAEGEKILVEANGSKVEMKAVLSEKPAKGHVLVPPVFSGLPINTLFTGRGNVAAGKVTKLT